MNFNKKLVLFWLIATLGTTICLGLISFGAYKAGVRTGEKRGKRIAVNFNTEIPVVESEHHYQFLPQTVSDYIIDLSSELEVDSDLVVAILMVENPEFNTEAVHRNVNGTIDCGLFQLNDRYVWTDFKDAYWFDNIELDPFNWKHNTYLAVHHISYLVKKLKVVDEAVMAYNCGITAVMSGVIPDSTRIYLKKVKINLMLLKQK